MRSRSYVLCPNLRHTKHPKLNHFKLLLAQNTVFQKKKMPMYHKNIFGKSMYSLHYWLSQRKLNRNEIKIQSITANQFAVVVLLIRQTIPIEQQHTNSKRLQNIPSKSGTYIHNVQVSQ